MLYSTWIVVVPSCAYTLAQAVLTLQVRDLSRGCSLHAGLQWSILTKIAFKNFKSGSKNSKIIWTFIPEFFRFLEWVFLIARKSHFLLMDILFKTAMAEGKFPDRKEADFYVAAV